MRAERISHGNSDDESHVICHRHSRTTFFTDFLDAVQLLVDKGHRKVLNCPEGQVACRLQIYGETPGSEPLSLLKAKQKAFSKNDLKETGSTVPTATERSQEHPSKTSPPMFLLPFHICLFEEDVPFHKQALFVVWMSTLGPLLLVIRLTLMLIVVSIKTHGGFEPWFYTSILNWFIDIQCDGDELKEDGRPVVFLSNHRLTHDIVVVTMATKTQFGMNGKVLVHPKIYNSFFFRYCLGSKRHVIRYVHEIGEVLEYLP
jgi:hypothetical protein